MRVEKRHRSALYGLEIEANRSLEKYILDGRDFSRSDINWDLTPMNVHLVKADNWGKAVTMAIRDAGVKERKNSVVIIDGFYGASPEWFEDKPLNVIIEYFKDCLEFHEREYGKVMNAVIHFDEATPHLAVASVALKYDEDKDAYRLSARDIMGNRDDYRRRQDRFYEEVGKSRGLERGESYAPEDLKKHLTVQEYKNQKLQEENEELQRENEYLKHEYKILQWKNDRLAEMNEDLANQIENPFMQFCMSDFIKRAKVKGEKGEIKSVADGFAKYMELHYEKLRVQWQEQFPVESIYPTGYMEEQELYEYEREIDYDYDERER